jgi:HTH-type transcriptional regulator/antitoxin MqsA
VKKNIATDLESCPVCGENIIRECRDILLSYKDNEVTIEQPGQYCIGCGESFFNSSDLAVTRKQRADFQREVDHLLKSDEIKEIRKKINLSQKKAGSIFGGGPMAFSKYERGIVKQTRSLDVLMRLISNNKISLADILEVEGQA